MNSFPLFLNKSRHLVYIHAGALAPHEVVQQTGLGGVGA